MHHRHRHLKGLFFIMCIEMRYMLIFYTSEKTEVVHKESFFSEELTEEEKILVAKRVAQHQQQFAAYEKRERARKAKKIRAIFDHVDNEEIAAMLRDCDNDEVCFFSVSVIIRN